MAVHPMWMGQSLASDELLQVRDGAMNEHDCTRLVRRRAISHDESLHIHMKYLPCERCGMFSDRLERHHRQFRSRGGDWAPSNIVLICNSCHDEATNEEPWARHSGYNVGTYQEPMQVPLRLWHAGWVLLTNEGGFVKVDN